MELKSQLACSECGEVGTYFECSGRDGAVCTKCGNEVGWIDLEPERDEWIDFDESGALAVYEIECTCGSLYEDDHGNTVHHQDCELIQFRRQYGYE